jgi:hypothetical protein
MFRVRVRARVRVKVRVRVRSVVLSVTLNFVYLSIFSVHQLCVGYEYTNTLG